MRDYAKSKKSNITKTARRDRRLSSAMLILSLVFAGCAIFHFAYQHFPLDKKVFLPAPAATTHADKTHKKKKSKSVSAATSANNNQPRYDFYKLLPRMTVVVPKKDQTLPH